MNLLFANDRPGEYPTSWYAATARLLAPFDPLDGDTDADVCVVGGGYTGLSAALHLRKLGLSVRLIEAHRVGFGASGRNGGQVGSGQRLDQDALEGLLGARAAHILWDLAEEAKASVKGLIDAHAIDCAWRPGVVTACRTPAEVREAHAYAEKLRDRYAYDRTENLSAEALRAIVPSGEYCGGVIDRGAAHIHPLDYALGLARAAADAGARLHERTLATRIEPGARPVVHTDRGRVTCGQVIVAANGYLGSLDRHMAARVMPINNFMIATEPLGPRAREVLTEDVAVADTRFVVNYWRLSADRRLLFGGGETYGYRFPADISRIVLPPMLKVYPRLRDVRIDHAWGGTLAITVNRMPYFARSAPGVLSASACSGHGVALSTLAGKLLAEAVSGRTDRFDLMASVPSPRFPGGPALRSPLLVLAMSWYALRDRLAV
ncbi:MAG: NAD(P)/FAD-dependent oxidoreductase [Pseudomonadota bacterium]